MYRITDEMVSCPYNPFHIVSKLRIQKHLTKCKEQYSYLNLATCFYNYSHKIKPEELLSHYEVCPSKIRVEANRYYDKPLNCKFSEVDHDINSSLESFFKDTLSLKTICCDNDEKSVEYCSSEVEEKNSGVPICDDFSCDYEELEPLPLPKTVSKAFSLGNKKALGRGAYLLLEYNNMIRKKVGKTSSYLEASQKVADFPLDSSKLSTIQQDSNLLKSEGGDNFI